MASSRQILEGLDQLREWGDCGPIAMNSQRVPDPITATVRSAKTERRRTALARTIEGEIIPRLMLAHGTQAQEIAVKRSRSIQPTDDDVEEFCRLLILHDVTVASAYLDALREQGASLEMLLLELIAPAARLLGEMWKSDLRDFTDVTIGLARMHRLLHDISPEFATGGLAPCQKVGSVLLAGTPGEQHTLGILIVEEFFRRAGWDVWSATTSSAQEIIGIAKREHLHIVGFSLSCTSLIETLASVIKSVRKASRNRSVQIFVGGNLFVEQPELVARVGADGTALDGRQAVLRLPNLLASKGS